MHLLVKVSQNPLTQADAMNCEMSAGVSATVSDLPTNCLVRVSSSETEPGLLLQFPLCDSQSATKLDGDTASVLRMQR